MSDGITVPAIEIGPDWYVDDLQTVQDCDDALAYLTEAISSIERQLLIDGREGGRKGARWTAGAQTSLRFKKHALEVTTRRRAFFASEERRAAALIKQTYPEIWAWALGQSSVAPSVAEIATPKLTDDLMSLDQAVVRELLAE